MLIDELLAKNFAVLGATGSGKSCAVTLMLSAILAHHPSAHIIVLDPHNEYASAFGEHAEFFNVDNLQLPLWLLDFEEAVGRAGPRRDRPRAGNSGDHPEGCDNPRAAPSLERRGNVDHGDAPLPFAAADLLRFIDEAMGKLDNPNTSAPYLRLGPV